MNTLNKFKVGSVVESIGYQKGIVVDRLLFCSVKQESRFDIKVKFFNGAIEYYNIYGNNYTMSDLIQEGVL